MSTNSGHLLKVLVMRPTSSAVDQLASPGLSFLLASFLLAPAVPHSLVVPPNASGVHPYDSTSDPDATTQAVGTRRDDIHGGIYAS